MDPAELQEIEKLIGVIEDFPKPGIVFRDIFPIFRQPDAVKKLMQALCSAIESLGTRIDVIAGL